MSRANNIIGPIPNGSEALLLASMSEQTLVYIATNDREMEELRRSLLFFAPDRKILEFPAWDNLPYDRSPPNPQIVSKRISALCELARNENVSRETLIILTTVNAILQKLPPKDVFLNNHLGIIKGEKSDREHIIKFLSANGYDRVSKVVESGEFAVRGSIIDIFPSASEIGVRIDFFDDQVEQLKEFEPLSQLSIREIESFNLYPASELIIDDNIIETFRGNYRKIFGAATNSNPLYESIISKIKFHGSENWLPLFYEQMLSFYDYLPENSKLIFGHLTQETAKDRLELIQDYYQSRLESSDDYRPVPADSFYLNEVNNSDFETLELSLFNGEEYINSGFKKITNPKYYFDKPQAANKPILIACFSEGSATHTEKILENKSTKIKKLDIWQNVSRETLISQINIFVAPINESFETQDYIIISEQDIFGDRFIRQKKKRRKPENFLQEASSLDIHELVVHENHGIGKFAGLETIDVNGILHDMVRLVYANDDRLFVPVENIDSISRYGAADEDVQLDKLGGVSWQERTARLKKRIKLLADELLKIAAEREIKKGEVINLDINLYEEFCSRFPFAETDDQLNAIEDVFEDFSKGKPMDRLICGDVGFGKTEIALRAAFAAAANGGQAAIICPTTLLSRQHYDTFQKRFAGLPFELCQMSRMVTNAQLKKNKELIAAGKIDIVIGTHALLADDMKFKKLSLIIIDEEQHFGVAQKEKLKKLKSEVHILSLSATPIPRSLQLAITGVRDLSIIATPPIDRLAVRTFVSQFDELTIREAILRERNRGGRIFFVAPRLADLDELHKTISNLVPEIKIGIAHGQLKPDNLDRIMNDFYEGKFDLLLSTAIVESGLDIQSANTIFVYKAEMFGLSQLYQLRGRVGRAKTRGYAYFVLPKNKTLTKNAYKRLEVIQGLDSLGAGFSVASHDMDIRGFGNLLGDEQSGHVREVGVELYQRMLQEAVLRAKAEGEVENKESFTPSINLGMSVLIAEHYVPDLDLRMGLYKRAASLENQDEITDFIIEITDRFGKPPKEVYMLLEVIKLKNLCRKIGIAKIDIGPKAMVLQFTDVPNIGSEAIMFFVNNRKDSVKIKPDNKLVIAYETDEREELVHIIEDYLNEILLLTEPKKAA